MHLILCLVHQGGKQYLVRVTATDGSGVSGFVDSSPIRIVGQNHNLTPAQVAATVASTVSVSCILVALVSFLVVRHRCACASMCRTCPASQRVWFEGRPEALTAVRVFNDDVLSKARQGHISCCCSAALACLPSGVCHQLLL